MRSATLKCLRLRVVSLWLGALVFAFQMPQRAVAQEYSVADDYLRVSTRNDSVHTRTIIVTARQDLLIESRGFCVNRADSDSASVTVRNNGCPVYREGCAVYIVDDHVMPNFFLLEKGKSKRYVVRNERLPLIHDWHILVTYYSPVVNALPERRVLLQYGVQMPWEMVSRCRKQLNFHFQSEWPLLPGGR